MYQSNLYENTSQSLSPTKITNRVTPTIPINKYGESSTYFSIPDWLGNESSANAFVKTKNNNDDNNTRANIIGT